MSRIQPIVNYKSNLNQNIRLTPGPSFTGAAAAAADAEMFVLRGVRNEIRSSLSPTGRFLDSIYLFLAEHNSEIQSQAINALFTATLATVMIRNNPFAKKTTSPQTLAYSSIRQPVSAGIAISGGVAMTMAVNAYMDSLYNGGHIGTIDGRMKPAKNFIKKGFKKEYNAATDKQKFLDSCKPEDYGTKEFKGNGKPKGRYKEACLEGYANKIYKIRENLFEALIGENPKNIIVNERKEILLNGKKLGENIPKLGTQKELEDYLAKNSLYNLQLKDVADEIQKVLQAYRNKSDNKTVKDFINERFKNIQSKGVLQDLLEGKTSAENKTLGEFLSGLKVGNVEAEVRNFAKDLLKNKLSRMGNDFKNFKGYTNIFFNLFTTAITCTILNWAYPRIIERFLPDLMPGKSSQQAKQPTVQKGGNK